MMVASFCMVAVVSAPARGLQEQPCRVCACLEEVGEFGFGKQPPPEDADDFPLALPSCEWSDVPAGQISESSFTFMLPHMIDRYANLEEPVQSACSARWRFMLENLSRPLEPICVEGEAPMGDAFTDEVIARCDEDQHLFAAARAADQRARSESVGDCPAWGDLTARAIVFLRGDNVNFLRARQVLERLVPLVEAEPQLERPLWLIIQHASNEPSFQQAGLEAYTTLFESGLGDSQRYASLVDRILLNAENQQRYGTHWRCLDDGTAILSTELAAPDTVDEDRARLGLPPLEDFLGEVTEERCSTSE